MAIKPINLQKKLGSFADRWSPRIIAQLNDYHIKLAKIQGEFVWHKHSETDEVFFVIKGRMRLELRDQVVHMEQGELYFVPRRVERKPVADGECHIMLIEPAGTRNTGDVEDEHTQIDERWI